MAWAGKKGKKYVYRPLIDFLVSRHDLKKSFEQRRENYCFLKVILLLRKK